MSKMVMALANSESFAAGVAAAMYIRDWGGAAFGNDPGRTVRAVDRYHSQMNRYDPIHIKKCQWGSLGVKPRRLRAMGFTKLRQALEQCKTHNVKKKPLAKDGHGAPRPPKSILLIFVKGLRVG